MVNNVTSSSLLEATGMDDRNDGNVTYLSLLVFKWAVEQQHARVLDLSPHLGVGYILVEHDAIQDLTKKNHKEVRNGRRTKKPTAADYAMKPHQASVEYRIETFNISQYHISSRPVSTFWIYRIEPPRFRPLSPVLPVFFIMQNEKKRPTRYMYPFHVSFIGVTTSLSLQHACSM